MRKAAACASAPPGGSNRKEGFLRGGAHYRLGLAEVDQQHEEIRAMVNGLYAARNQAREQWLPVFTGLGPAVALHFRTEERLMRRHRFPGAADHRDRHSRLLERFASLAAAVERGGALDEAVFLFLKFWLRDHMLGPDRRMAQFLRSTGER